jgi:hypothetical protein
MLIELFQVHHDIQIAFHHHDGFIRLISRLLDGLEILRREQVLCLYKRFLRLVGCQLRLFMYCHFALRTHNFLDFIFEVFDIPSPPTNRPVRISEMYR